MKLPIPIDHERSRRLSADEFEWGLVAGLGRAATAWPVQQAELRDVLLTAGLSTPSIDAQVDSRYDWIASMIQTATDPAYFVEHIVAAGVERENNRHTWDSYHRIGIIQHFARRGEFGCREWMLRNLVDGRLEEEWLEVAGWEGIVDVAKARGASGLLDDESDAFIFDAYRFAVDDGSERGVRALLEQEATTNPDVAAYLDAVDSWLVRRDAGTGAAPWSVRFDFGDVDPDLKGPRLRPWFEAATSTQLEKVLSWIERADSDDRWRLVSAWKNWGPPLHRFSDALYAWLLEHINRPSEDEEFSRRQLLGHSVRLLGTLEDPRVRELGVIQLEARDIETGCRLLRGNWEHGDALRVVDALPVTVPATLEERYEYHDRTYALTDLLAAVDDDELVPVANWVYLLNPCANCRNDAVKWLRRKGAFTSAMEAEYENDVWNHDAG